VRSTCFDTIRGSFCKFTENLLCISDTNPVNYLSYISFSFSSVLADMYCHHLCT